MIGPKLSSPVLAGLRKTALYLPPEQYSMEELQLVFYHELSHYKCHDLWYRMLLLTVSTIYWFNPLLYLMEKEAEKDIENLCDSSVIRFCEKTERLAYNRLLLKTASFQHHIPYLATSLNDSTLVFKERILYMVNAASMNRRLTPALLLTAALTLTYTGIGCTIGEAPVLPGLRNSGSILTVSENSGTADSYNAANSSISGLSRVPLYTDSVQKQTLPETISGTAVTLPSEISVHHTETVQTSVTALSQTVYSTGTVNVRSGAGTEFAVIETASKNMQLAQTGISSNGWVQINWNGVTGYVSQDYITNIAPAENSIQLPPEEGEVFTEAGKITLIKDSVLFLDNTYTDGGVGPREFYIGHLDNRYDYTEGDYVTISYAGTFQTPNVLDVQKHDTSPVTISPNAFQDSEDTLALENIEDSSTISMQEEISATPMLLFDGTFREPARYDEAGEPIPNSDRYMVQVSNATKSSFDFSITLYDCYGNPKATDVSGTADFTSATTAEYYGNEYSLSFALSGYNSHPVITFMNISGYEPLEGIQVYNNAIPGFGFN